MKRRETFTLRRKAFKKKTTHEFMKIAQIEDIADKMSVML